jgi:type IV pilus assembly protein PilB
LNEEIREALIKMKPSQTIREIAIESAELITLLEDGIYKATQGLTTVNEIFRCLPRLVKPKQIQEIFRLQN